VPEEHRNFLHESLNAGLISILSRKVATIFMPTL